MLAAIRIRGVTSKRKDIEDTLKMLGLKKNHAMAILPRTDSILGMLRKVESMVAWGDIDEELAAKFSTKKANLKSPVKGFRSIKNPYPKGDLGYRGKEINELIKRMM